MTRRLAPLACLAIFCAPGLSRAQDDARNTQEPPAHISFVDGTAVLEREGRTEAAPASMPLLGGDRLRTQAGRVEVLFADGSTLHLDANTSVDFQSDEIVRLLDGRVRLMVAGPARDLSYRVDAPSAWVQINEPGDYRITIMRGESAGQVELAVLRGAAELVNEEGRSALRAGERAFARTGAAPSAPYIVNSAAWDAFDRWSEERRDRRLGTSSQYLPSDVRPYASTFDHYGSWQYEQPYGYVWYPRVSVGWRPYHYGRWASLRPYGWTWIGYDPWGWPTHHYGRWGFSAGSWFWIPGRHWGAAWVSWSYSPRYWSWCPLGWGNRPVFSLVNINVFGGRHYDHWRGWTAVERHHFGRGNVNVNLLAPSRMDNEVRRTFVSASRGPDVTYAVARGTAVTPIRSAGIRRTSDVSRPVTMSAGEFGNRRLPAPSRAPRDVGPLVERGTARAEAPPGVRAVPRSAPPPLAGDDRGARVSRGISSADAGTPAPDARRAVPRRDDVGTPSYGRSPGVRRDPGVAGGYPSVPVYRSTPSEAGPEMSPGYRRDPGSRRAPESSPPSGAGIQARPRSEPSGPPAAYGRSTGVERRAPSGPPPSAGPPSSDSGSGQVARPRGGAQPSGGSGGGAVGSRRRPGG